MTRANSKSSFAILAAGVVLAFVALWLGNSASDAIVTPGSGYLPFFLIAGSFVVFLGLAVCAPLSLFESIVAKPDVGPLTIALGAAVGLLCTAYFFGLAATPLTSAGEWTGPWLWLWIAGILPALAAAVHAARSA
ncbi:MAG: hypothetical protein KGR48_14935 [Alphaproteobacteria bacterium]|nr:hypothetical protein [Alphaproteobacteria bacterium]MBU6472864.1 hypothetical protein [Alphaproteobacteria bacterium]MDE2012957.1 hypothetical protein [Alphaproteobacteria bacterium]MDE2074596.1 hypothetical protein [Alphaproteobacteria bacterium]MDE2351432.1 hypothetical protein [Alphaproteobacteria bacterium]